MITVVYKSGKREDVTKLFLGRVNVNEQYNAMWLLAGMGTVSHIEFLDSSNHPSDDKVNVLEIKKVKSHDSKRVSGKT